jgi:hypothetical protein
VSCSSAALQLDRLLHLGGRFFLASLPRQAERQVVVDGRFVGMGPAGSLVQFDRFGEFALPVAQTRVSQ